MGIYTEWGPSSGPLFNSDEGYWDDTVHSDKWQVGPVNRGFRDHAEITHSDRVRPTPWYRETVQVTGETPSKAKYFWTHPTSGKTIADYTSTRWISTGQPDPAFWYPPPGYFPIQQNLNDRITTQALNKLNEGSFEALNAIGEGVQTAEMLAGRGKQAAQAILNHRAFMGTLGPAKARIASKFAGAWLEGYYGWGSLARDMYDLQEKLREQLGHDLLLHAGSKGTDSYEMKYGAQMQSTSKWTCQSQVGYLYQIDNEFVQSAKQWGLINPLSTAWELTPLSFVVDWFIPVGNVLSALTATAGLTFVGGYHTNVTECEDEMKADKPVNYGLVDWDPGSWTRSIYKMNRGTLSGFEVPKLYGNRNPFNTTRITSALALITQAVTGGKFLFR